MKRKSLLISGESNADLIGGPLVPPFDNEFVA